MQPIRQSHEEAIVSDQHTTDGMSVIVRGHDGHGSRDVYDAATGAHLLHLGLARDGRTWVAVKRERWLATERETVGDAIAAATAAGIVGPVASIAPAGAADHRWADDPMVRAQASHQADLDARIARGEPVTVLVIRDDPAHYAGIWHVAEIVRDPAAPRGIGRILRLSDPIPDGMMRVRRPDWDIASVELHPVADPSPAGYGIANVPANRHLFRIGTSVS